MININMRLALHRPDHSSENVYSILSCSYTYNYDSCITSSRNSIMLIKYISRYIRALAT